MREEYTIRKAIITLRESAKSLRHSGWKLTASECESMADELDTTMESCRMIKSIRQERMYFEAFCKGAVAGMNHDGRFEHPEEFGAWIRGEFDEWRKGDDE